MILSKPESEWGTRAPEIEDWRLRIKQRLKGIFTDLDVLIDLHSMRF